MLIDYFEHIRSPTPRVTHAVRIDHHRRANRAEAHRSTFSQHHRAFWILAFRFTAKQDATRFQFALEGLDHFGTVPGRAGFSGADKNVMANWSRRNRREQS